MSTAATKHLNRGAVPVGGAGLSPPPLRRGRVKGRRQAVPAGSRAQRGPCGGHGLTVPWPDHGHGPPAPLGALLRPSPLRGVPSADRPSSNVESTESPASLDTAIRLAISLRLSPAG